MQYSKMKDSGVEWIGKMPIGWKVIRNKALFEEVNERCEANPNLPLLSVSEYYGVAPRAEKIAEDEMLTRAESLEGYKVCHKNDIVMNIMLAWKRSQGVSQYDGIVSPAYCVFRRKDDAPIDMRYIHYLIRTDRYADEYKCHSTGIIDSRLRLYPDKFLALESHVPPLPEQTAIAAYLDEKCATIDGIIAEAKATIEEYKAWKASVIFEAVTKGLDPNAEMKDSGVEWIGQMPRGWSRDKINRIYGIIGSGTTPKFDDAKDNSGPINWILSGDVYSGGDITEVKNQIAESFLSEYSALKIYNPPFVVIAMYGASIGNMAISYISGCVNQACCVLGSPRENFNYAYYALQALKSHLLSSALGGGQPNISQQIIKAQWLPIPPLPEQTAIAAYLDSKCAAIDGVIAEKEALIAELETYKKSLIFETVTGKRRVC